MDFIPSDTTVLPLSFFLYIVGTPVMAFSLVAAIAVSAKEKRGIVIRRSLIAIGVVGAVAAIASAPASFIEYDELQAKRAETRQTIADGFTEYYGVKVTAEDIGELDYPLREPEEETVAGTTTLSSGMKVTLVVDEGNARLYKFGEELPVAD